MSGIERVRAYVQTQGIAAKIVELDSSTRTSQLAARALGCSVAEIAKSIVFIDDAPVIVVISGDKRVNISKLSQVVGRPVKIADAETVKQSTGYSIGGVPPFPHHAHVRVLLDRSLERSRKVWAAAGVPNAVMQLDVPTLRATVGAKVVDVAVQDGDL